MTVTATEFKTNFGKYLELIAHEDIFITRNGKTIAKVVNPQISAVESLRGMLKDLPADIDIDAVREERREHLLDVPTDIDRGSLREERLSKYEDNG